MIDDGPNFTPDTPFTNNMIVIDSTIGEGALVPITGGATVAPTDATSQAAIAVVDPVLELHNSDVDLIDSHDNWMDDPTMQIVSDADLAPGDPNESAPYKILPAGAYTAVVTGAGDTTGVALVETYNLD